MMAEVAEPPPGPRSPSDRKTARKKRLLKSMAWATLTLSPIKGQEKSQGSGTGYADMAMTDPIWRSLDRIQREQINNAVGFATVLLKESAFSPAVAALEP